MSDFFMFKDDIKSGKDAAWAASASTLVNNRRASRLQVRLFLLVLLVLLVLPPSGAAAFALTLSSVEATRIGEKIWQNECAGSMAGLTSWNEGENFASLGIGHFIWYPKGVPVVFEESFPKLVSFIAAHGAKLPALLLAPHPLDCPWRTRTQFMAAQGSSEMRQLRRFLADTVDLQAQFMAARLQEALPKMLTAAPPPERARIEHQFSRVAATAHGCYALVDYVNFKGEGVLQTERYQGEGWGLLQVLSGMPAAPDDASALNAFAASAANVLRQRVRNSPPARHESRWLPGWLNRVRTYAPESRP
jgi:hypothetical protein